MNLYGVRLRTSAEGSDFYILTAATLDDAHDIVYSWSLRSLDFEVYEGSALVAMLNEEYGGTATLSTF